MGIRRNQIAKILCNSKKISISFNSFLSDTLFNPEYICNKIKILNTCKSITAYIPDNPDLYEALTGIQYLSFIADIYKISKEQREKRLLYGKVQQPFFTIHQCFFEAFDKTAPGDTHR